MEDYPWQAQGPGSGERFARRDRRSGHGPARLASRRISSPKQKRGIDKKEVTAQMLEEFKTAVAKVLTPHASAILLDPEYGSARRESAR